MNEYTKNLDQKYHHWNIFKSSAKACADFEVSQLHNPVFNSPVSQLFFP